MTVLQDSILQGILLRERYIAYIAKLIGQSLTMINLPPLITSVR